MSELIFNNPESLSIVSYNIFFGKLETDTEQDILDRLYNLCSEIVELDATVICLQEVTSNRYEIIISHLEKIYPYRYPNKITQSYDTAIFSKQRIIKNTKIYYSVTRMARSIMCIIIESPFNNQKYMAITTSHLESEFGDKFEEMNTKLLQYSEALDILNQFSESCDITDIFFCADFNSHNKISDSILYKKFNYAKFKWKDCWIENGMDPDSEISFDSRSNPLMLKIHSNKKNKPNYVSRLDRIFHRSNLFVHEFNINKSDKLLSDHYPIFALFKSYPPSDKIDYIDHDTKKIKPKNLNSFSSKISRISLFKNKQ